MKKGYTLTELMLVVVILGILGAVSLPRFFPQTEKARVSEAVSVLGAIRTLEEGYYYDQGVYKIGLSDDASTDAEWLLLGMENPNEDAKYWIFTVEDNPPGYQAKAERADVPSGNDYVGDAVYMDENGSFCGSDHPLMPESLTSGCP